MGGLSTTARCEHLPAESMIRVTVVCIRLFPLRNRQRHRTALLFRFRFVLVYFFRELLLKLRRALKAESELQRTVEVRKTTGPWLSSAIFLLILLHCAGLFALAHANEGYCAFLENSGSLWFVAINC